MQHTNYMPTVITSKQQTHAANRKLTCKTTKTQTRNIYETLSCDTHEDKLKAKHNNNNNNRKKTSKTRVARE